MRIVILILGLFLGMEATAQTVTPNPGPYQPVSTKYQWGWSKWTGGAWVQGKLIVSDSTQLAGITYVNNAPAADSSMQAANTGWIKRNISPGAPGVETSAWSYTGNYGITANKGRLGYKDSNDLKIMTNNLVRLSIPATGINRRSNAVDRMLVLDTVTSELYYRDIPSGGGGSGISSLGDGYGLVKVNDSTYSVDTTDIATQYDLEGYLKYSGTGDSVMRGDVEFLWDTDTYLTKKIFSKNYGNSDESFIEFNPDTDVFDIGRRNSITPDALSRIRFNSGDVAINGSETQLSIGTEGVSIGNAVAGSVGLTGFQDFTPNIGPLDYPQKIYVDQRLADSMSKVRADSITNRALVDGKIGKLSTIGTSGPATKVGDSLNIPNYAGGGGGSAKAYPPLVVRNDSVYQRFNVLAYGADNTGVADATAAIQAAINAADAAGGGDVYFPNGIYLIAGAINATYNSQLYIPYRAFSSTARTHITLKGETRPNLTPTGGGLSFGAALVPPVTGVVFKSSLTSFTTAGQAVIGTRTDGLQVYNANYLSVENIAIQVKNNPSGTGPVVGGINYQNGASLQVRNVTVCIDTSGFRSTYPSNNVTGIETPDNSSEINNLIENTVVVGFKNGHKIGEHVVLIQAQNYVCSNAFYLKDGYHNLTSVRSTSQWCNYAIYNANSVGARLSNFQLDCEWQQIGKWYDDIATIKDTANKAYGMVVYSITEASVGVNNSRFSIVGGSNLHYLSNDQGYAAANSSMAIGNPVVSGTAGSIPFLGTSGVLRQDNANFFYDSTNHRIGMGDITPSYNLEIKNSGVAHIGITGTTSTTGGSIDLFNDAGTQTGLKSFGTAHALWPNNAVIFGSASLVLNSDALVTSGGTSSIRFRTGGNAAAQERMRLYSNGALGINTTIDSLSGKLIVDGAISGTTATALTVRGSAASGANLTLSSTSNATKGKVLFGNSAYDEVNNRLGLGITSPTAPLHVNSTTSSTVATFNNGSGSGNMVINYNTGSNTNVNHVFQNNAANVWYFGNTGVGGVNTFRLLNSDANSNAEKFTLLQSGNAGFSVAAPTSTLHTTSFATAYTATATSISATIAHNVIEVTATGQTITLPTAVGITGRHYTIKLTASGTGTVATTSSQTIDGSTTYSLTAQYKYVTVQSTGANWIIIANN